MNVEGAEQLIVKGMEDCWGKVRHVAISCNDFRFRQGESEFFKTKHNIDAEQIRLAFCDRFDKNFKKFENWKREDFDVVAQENETSKKLEVVSGEAKPEDLMAIVNRDKLALQSYGRPYTTAEGKPQGKFYSFAPNTVTEIQFW